MIKSDVHVHTYYCDGKNSPEEMIQSAINKGLDVIGILTHSYTYFDESYCIKKENVKVFQNEVAELKDKYKDKIKVLCGVEQDAYSTYSTEGFDYVIGSCHYFKVNDKFYPVDFKADIFHTIVKEVFNGDYYLASENYYNKVAEIGEQMKPDIIGHFDLITKYNEYTPYIDEDNKRYEKAYKYAVDKLLPFNIPFEINTGAISRGHRTTPYPSEKIYHYIKDNGGKFVLNSDSHNKDTIAFQYDKYIDLIK